ncbi:VOC family protein [Afifella sp. IM 167]|uniref:VOC family protein n=1 Tax=Afifella sp. IM 167 TaxID=2033586 RepID=UPI001CC9AFC8|nr:VOC family protein [Afifella sp. IM 167]MBZ8133889.1 glyoxalase [Afifella sp. IM 167]
MTVRRIVANIASDKLEAGKSFYGAILGMHVAMDHGWILTFAGDGLASPQISIASEGGSGAQVPDISIEVDNLDEVLARVKTAGLPIEYGPASEPWGVVRFFVRDPFGRLVNLLSHG